MRMIDLVGQRIGQYEIVEQVAKGGMATVYRALQPSMGRHVAIKVLPPNFTHDSTFIQRFNQEVEVIAQLQHPHILPVYDYGEFESQPYIVMAFLSGGTLSDKLAEGIMTHYDVGRMISQIADALDFAHSKGIIHRDLKPGNVLLDERNNAYLADFGLAKLTQSTKNITGTNVIGTPSYMAPEQAQSSTVTASVDIYALGVTAYKMLAGVVPYDAPTMAAVLIAHITKPVPDIREARPELNDQIQQVIQQALAKDVAERYQTAGALAHDLVAALENRLHETRDDVIDTQSMPQPSLLMTNMLGHVIFVDNQCLNLLKRHHNEARNIMGKPIGTILGWDNKVSNEFITALQSSGEVNDWEVDVIDSRGNNQPVRVSAVATRDDDGTFVGADVTLASLPKPENRPSSESFQTMSQIINTEEKNYLQTYFIAQLESLYDLMANWAGPRVARNLEDIINETGRRNVWPVTMTKGRVTVELKSTDLEVYQALLTRGMVYAANIIGTQQVIKEMEYVNKNTKPSVFSYVQTLGMDRLYDVLLS
jgi:serine/threonine protein kinase